jgi:hypothetical protein
MTRICPRCGNPNDDAVRFCTSCGNPLVPQAGQPVPAAVPSPGQVPPAAPSGQSRTFRNTVIAAVVIIVILAALYFLQASGTIRIFPSAAPAVTPQVTQAVTSFVTTGTPLPDTTTPVQLITTAITIVTRSPVTSPTTTKALVCPSDRYPCGAVCRDIMTDRNNCGGCNVSCTGRESCQQGHCMARCSDTETSCPDGCHDLQYDTLNCGICGNICPVGLVCNKSVCTPPLKTIIPTYLG